MPKMRGKEGTNPMRRRGSIATIGPNLERIRKARDMTQRELARAVGLSSVMIYHYEAGNSEPKASTLYKIAWHLDVPISVFYREIDETTCQYLSRCGAA